MINKLKYVDEIDILNNGIKSNKKIIQKKIIKKKVVDYLLKNKLNLNAIIDEVKIINENSISLKINYFIA